MKNVNIVFAISFLAIALSGCNIDEKADSKMNAQQEKLSAEAVMTVGMPAIVNFTEKRVAKMLFELRDDPKLVTITYTRDMQGKLHKVCDSLGYGLPYATQYTSPQKRDGWEHPIALPQADPNGLFSPATADATWVMCVDPADKKLKPVYVEDRITVSQFVLPSE